MKKIKKGKRVTNSGTAYSSLQTMSRGGLGAA